MRSRAPTILLATLALAGCDPEPEPDRSPPASLIRQVFSGIPLIPGAAIGGVQGEGEAAQATVSVPQPPDTVAAWYRRALLAGGWTIAGDVRTADGVITLHATDRAGRPIWLLIGGPGPTTTMTVVGAVPEAADSTR
jgi:hypothetical protein